MALVTAPKQNAFILVITMTSETNLHYQPNAFQYFSIFNVTNNLFSFNLRLLGKSWQNAEKQKHQRRTLNAIVS